MKILNFFKVFSKEIAVFHNFYKENFIFWNLLMSIIRRLNDVRSL